MNLQEEEGVDELVLNLTPMIDVIFLLLIFFMVATTFADPERELDVDLPQASTGSSPKESLDELVINILRDGTLMVSGKTMEPAELDRILRAKAQDRPDTPVTIRGDRLVHHEVVVSVMDACGRAGLRQLSLGTLEER
ncbi:MAG: biopolymer transporter ExbD [Planctomycetes bacterium]|nr:biopolymer transporter ExbD [Planctomycetota bacterium]HPF12762.1 biopolymer transporter ExbD [Planctomycetota bacterium]HRV81349.1 biopolymer transporter ExbD [Planctomycetota bacterium]